MNNIVRWEKPPPPKYLITDWREVSRLLRSRPGEWAVVYEGRSENAARAQYTNLRKGSVLAMLPRSEFEYARRNRCVYSRYVGLDTSGLVKSYEPRSQHPDPVIRARQAALRAI